MRASVVAGLLAIGSANAFSDSSPFVMLSTAEFPAEAQNMPQLQTNLDILRVAENKIINTCPTSSYLIVYQPSVHADDVFGADKIDLPSLRGAWDAKNVHGRMAVKEGIPHPGHFTVAEFDSVIRKACKKANVEPKIEKLEFTTPPSAEFVDARQEAILRNDAEMSKAISEGLATDDLTAIYLSHRMESNPPRPPKKVVQAEAAASRHLSQHNHHQKLPKVHHDAQAPVVKRAVHPARAAGSPSAEIDSKLPLFEKYQYFTPGVFMSLTVLLTLLSILYVGISSVASLQVSYGAFDKEMGPAAQKKQ